MIFQVSSNFCLIHACILNYENQISAYSVLQAHSIICTTVYTLIESIEYIIKTAMFSPVQLSIHGLANL